MRRIPVSGSGCALLPLGAAYHTLLITDYYRKTHHTTGNSTTNHHTTCQSTTNHIRSSRRRNCHIQFSTTQITSLLWQNNSSRHNMWQHNLSNQLSTPCSTHHSTSHHNHNVTTHRVGAVGPRLAFIWQGHLLQRAFWRSCCAFRLAGAEKKAFWRECCPPGRCWLSCGKRRTSSRSFCTGGRGWAALRVASTLQSLLKELVRAAANFRVAGAVYGAFWRSCCTFRKAVASRRASAFVWQAQEELVCAWAPLGRGWLSCLPHGT